MTHYKFHRHHHASRISSHRSILSDNKGSAAAFAVVGIFLFVLTVILFWVSFNASRKANTMEFENKSFIGFATTIHTASEIQTQKDLANGALFGAVACIVADFVVFAIGGKLYNDNKVNVQEDIELPDPEVYMYVTPKPKFEKKNRAEVPKEPWPTHCPECGAPVDEGECRCSYCGARIK